MIQSNGLSCFSRFVNLGHAHTRIESEGGGAVTKVKGARWVNVTLGNVKRAINDCYRAIKHAE